MRDDYNELYELIKDALRDIENEKDKDFEFLDLLDPPQEEPVKGWVMDHYEDP